ncbi:unnamed protein product [Prunus armeniaca]
MFQNLCGHLANAPRRSGHCLQGQRCGGHARVGGARRSTRDQNAGLECQIEQGTLEAVTSGYYTRQLGS